MMAKTLQYSSPTNVQVEIAVHCSHTTLASQELMTPAEKLQWMAYSRRKRKDSENMEEVRRKELDSISPSTISNSKKQDASELEKGKWLKCSP